MWKAATIASPDSRAKRKRTGKRHTSKGSVVEPKGKGNEERGPKEKEVEGEERRRRRRRVHRYLGKGACLRRWLQDLSDKAGAGKDVRII
mmetsp:Transcript_37076/g.92269  ORF Transcript_37076/g.92269 Transcript_37076/m.92269 type:complete len:90 (+) Transcript_37076:798-1067(+)